MQHVSSAHEAVCRLLARLRCLRKHVHLTSCVDLSDQGALNLAQALVGVALERRDAVRRRQEGVHVLARAAAVDRAREMHGTQITPCRVERDGHHPA